MNEKEFVKMIVSNFMLIEANQLTIIAKLHELQLHSGMQPDKIRGTLAPTYKMIDNLKELMCELNKPHKIFTLGHGN